MAATGFGMCAKQISAMRMWVVAEIIIIMVIPSVPWDQKWSVFVGNQCLSRSWAGVGLVGFWRENGVGLVWLGRGNPSKNQHFLNLRFLEIIYMDLPIFFLAVPNPYQRTCYHLNWICVLICLMPSLHFFLCTEVALAFTPRMPTPTMIRTLWRSYVLKTVCMGF